MAKILLEVLDRDLKRYRPSFRETIYPCLCSGSNETCKKDLMDWCTKNKIEPIVIDAQNISVIDIGRWEASSQFVLTFNPHLKGKNYDFNSFKQSLVNLSESDYKAEGMETFVSDKKPNDDIGSIINLDVLPEQYFIKDGIGFEAFEISNLLAKKLNDKPCVLYIENLFTLEEEYIEMICRRFIRPDDKPHYSRNTVVAIIVDIEKDQKLSFFLRQKGIFISYIDNE